MRRSARFYEEIYRICGNYYLVNERFLLPSTVINQIVDTQKKKNKNKKT